jgi:FkbM family methyltransferase
MVIAIEADPSNADILRKNIQQNKFEPQTQILECAVGKEESRTLFEPGGEPASGQGSLSISDRKRAISITQTTLDRVMEGQGFVDVLKTDVEGADTWVLEGAKQLLKDHRIGHIFYEQEPSRMEELGISSRQAHELLRSEGYRIEQIGQNEYHATVE